MQKERRVKWLTSQHPSSCAQITILLKDAPAAQTLCLAYHSSLPSTFTCPTATGPLINHFMQRGSLFSIFTMSQSLSLPRRSPSVLDTLLEAAHMYLLHDSLVNSLELPDSSKAVPLASGFSTIVTHFCTCLPHRINVLLTESMSSLLLYS